MRPSLGWLTVAQLEYAALGPGSTAQSEVGLAVDSVTHVGLDEYVGCSCFRDGATSEPPVPRSQIVVGTKGLPEAGLDQGRFGQ